MTRDTMISPKLCDYTADVMVENTEYGGTRRAGISAFVEKRARHGKTDEHNASEHKSDEYPCRGSLLPITTCDHSLHQCCTGG